MADGVCLEPFQKFWFRITSGRNQNIHGHAAPGRAAGEDDDFATVWPHPLRQPTVLLRPAAKEDPARICWPCIVDGAVVSRTVRARFAKFDVVAFHPGFDPTLAAKRTRSAWADCAAGAAGFLFQWGRGGRLTAAIFEFSAAAARADGVTAGFRLFVHCVIYSSPRLVEISGTSSRHSPGSMRYCRVNCFESIRSSEKAQ